MQRILEAVTPGARSLMPSFLRLLLGSFLLGSLICAGVSPASDVPAADAPGADANAMQAQPTVTRVSIWIALRSFGEDEKSLRDAEQLLSRLARALERPRADLPLEVGVGEQALLPGDVLAYAGGADPELEMRRRAADAGAGYLLVGSVTRLGDRGSFELRVLPAGEGPALSQRVEAGTAELGLDAAIEAAVGSAHATLLRHAGPPPLYANAQEELPETTPPVDPGEASDDATPSEPETAPSEPQETPSEPQAAPSEPEFPELGPAPTEDFLPLRGALPVVEVRVEGNRRIEPDAIRAVIGTREGESLDRDRIAQDIRRIFELGFFRNVESLVTPVRGGAAVTFLVEENPVIREVAITGNESLGSDDVKEVLTLTVGSTVDRTLIFENERRIEALYQSRGFYTVDVNSRIEPLTETTVAVNFEVNEGSKLRLRRVEFEGNQALSDDELRAGLSTKPWRWYSRVSQYWDRSGTYAEPVFFQDMDRVQRKYMDQGFIRAKLSDPEVKIEEDGLRVIVSVEEGPQYSVGDVDVSGDESMNTQELLALVQLQPGQVFNRTRLTEDVDRLRSFYGDRGFFSAGVRPRTDVDSQELKVDVLFEVDKGTLFFVDDINVQGNRRTRDAVIRRELGIAEGELFSAKALERSRVRVRRLGYFEEVNVNAEPVSDHEVDVTVDVVERPTGSFSFGAGFGSTDGFLLNGALRQDNLFGRGYGLNLQADFGSRARLGFLSFSDRFFMGSPASLTTSLQLTEREFIDFDQELRGFDIDLSYPLDEDETRVGTGYAFKSRDISGFSAFNASSLLQREEFQGRSTASLATLSLVRDTRDDIRFPKRGQISGAALEFAGLGGLTQFVRVEGRTTWWLPLRGFLPFESTFVVNSRVGYALPLNDLSDFDLPDCDAACQLALTGLDPAKYGHITQLDDDLELPLSERYFLGGIGAFQVRGFRQRSLGPRRPLLRPFTASGIFVPSDCNIDQVTNAPTRRCNDIEEGDVDELDLDFTDVIGGNKMALLNFELQFPISEELGLTGLVFFDMGNAFAEDESINPADFRIGTGVGAIWFSPFGPILVQLGFPLDALEDEDGTVFEFTVGGSQF
jgi:outer membrane protein insertion porin family